MLAIEKEEGGKILLCKTIVHRAIGRIGSTEYRELYIARENGKEEEVIYGGEYACAYETTAAFHNLGLLRATHTTVDGFEAEVSTSPDWAVITHPRPGAIGILERKVQLDGSLGTRHTFTCLDWEGNAVHNEAQEDVRAPQQVRITNFKHHSGEQRAVQIYYIHYKLLIN